MYSEHAELWYELFRRGSSHVETSLTYKVMNTIMSSQMKVRARRRMKRPN